ncbi:YeeE/YedE thiosulfate transporter family protein [Gaoshiqia sp. Z1-71]|uniref:YeeE/YedE thiosulfate transporter family protein n=1 Tax=Gaoshiqia hydrogeniformans TaxID=3290090 RepID=UPI003BF81F7F
MGPIVPYIISDEFNLIIALIIGIGFGFILEQAGFSSTKKLVGVFYGYDFTVLRVFFTAGVTAMIGVVLLNHFGILDVRLIYVNPTFLRSAIIGGIVMGAGFIIGGFCPGTGVCAASIGKMNGMLFVLGGFVGVFLFMETYPLIKDFYLADAMGPLKMNEQLGLSTPLFAFLMTAVALMAFYFTWKIEKRVRKSSYHTSRIWVSRYAFASLVPFAVIAVIFIFPDREQLIASRVADAQRQKKCVFHEITADKLADEIVNHYYELNVIDVRSPEEYEVYHLPMAINIPFEELTDRKWAHLFKQKMKTNIFYADSDTLVKMSCLKARFVGKSRNLILRESAHEFHQLFYEPALPEMTTASKQEINEYHFRNKAARDMDALTEALKNIGKPVTMEVKVASGGCS